MDIIHRLVIVCLAELNGHSLHNGVFSNVVLIEI